MTPANLLISMGDEHAQPPKERRAISYRAAFPLHHSKEAVMIASLTTPAPSLGSLADRIASAGTIFFPNCRDWRRCDW